jgi:hypothetical protein
VTARRWERTLPANLLLGGVVLRRDLDARSRRESHRKTLTSASR